MSFRLVEVHLPGTNYDNGNNLPNYYGGVIDILSNFGVVPLATTIVTYNTQIRDDLTQKATFENRHDITYTGTYGDLPQENIDHLLANIGNTWNIIITGRYWGACHWTAFRDIVEESKIRKPRHVNFHFIKPLIDGLGTRDSNQEVPSDLSEGYGVYTTELSRFGLMQSFIDSEAMFTRYRLGTEGFENEEEGIRVLPGNPDILTTTNICFWSGIQVMLDAAKEQKFEL